MIRGGVAISELKSAGPVLIVVVVVVMVVMGRGSGLKIPEARQGMKCSKVRLRFKGCEHG